MKCHRSTLLCAIALAGLTLSAPAQQPATGAAPTRQTGSVNSTDILLDGSDWRMGSFAFDAGEAQGAAAQAFDDSAFRRVTVPGDTQMQAGFTGVERFRESKELLAVNRKEWWYRKQFHAGLQQPGSVSRIVFDGSDYFTTVWLNGKLLGSHEGTYTPFSFDVTAVLRHDGENLLAVKVTHPWVPKDRSMEEFLGGNFNMAQPWALPVLSQPPYYIDVRWDALPAQGNAAFPMGIWRSVHLETTGALTLEDLHALTVSIGKDGSALLRLSATVRNAGSTAQSRQIDLLLKPDNFDGPSQQIPALTIKALPGETTVTAEVRVPHAQLWWSWDEGPQNLYDLHAGIGPANRETERTIRFGIRTVTRSEDMAYHVNGQKLFTKASWFPIEDMYRSTPTAHDYERDLRLFRDANYNMLVNFTVVEKPEFYNLCDELGILVVTELPFEQFGPQQVMDKDSPRREPFLQQVRLQVPQIVKQLRSHPSIIEWAPMAEAHDKDLGRWGLNSINPDQAGYDTFVATIKGIVDRLSPDTIFHPSLCDLGEQHFWMAEAGARYIESNYQEQFDAQAGFISEFGSISLTSAENLGKYLTPEQQWGFKTDPSRLWFNLPIDTTAYAYWTAHLNDGLYSMLYRTIHFIDAQPRSATELVQDTQLYQAFLMRYASEAYRRKKYEPVNGIRSWDYLELAPGFRMGILDYDRVPKTAYWYMKHVQAPLSISFAYKEALESKLACSPWSAPVWVVNDFHHAVRGTLHTELISTAGQTIAAQDDAITVPSDGKLMATTFSVTLPQAPGVYVLHATLTTADEAEPVDETSFIKVVPSEFAAPHRVLLLVQKKFAAPIRAILESLGLTVDLYDENSIDIMARDLSDAAALHKKYDVVWLGSFEAIAKVLPPQSAQAIREAVRLGTGFIHTGGIGSFHGGQGHAAVLEATSLADILPVEISGREDTVFGGHAFDDVLKTERGFKDISPAGTAGAYPAEGLDLLRRFGVVAFNQVTPRPGSHTQLSVGVDPLLVTGTFGAGKTAAFTGFTPQTGDNALLPFDQYLMAEPPTRAFFVLFGELLADVLPPPQQRPASLLGLRDKPLFQTLKELPRTQLAVSATSPATADATWTRSTLHIENKGGYAHLVHMRIEWNDNASRPYVFEFGDNDFELFQQQSKDIELRWRGVDPTHAGGILIVGAASSPEIRLSF
jgi:beta-mannosidase